MPFAEIERPALGLSLLKARLAADGHTCRVLYPGLAFAHLLGRTRYRTLASGLPFTAFAGEWVFAEALYGADAPAQAGYAEDMLAGVWRRPREDVELVAEVRPLATAFTTDLAASVAWDEYDVIGFTSTFMQNLASLALAKRIRELHRGPLIFFGGHNWSGVAGEELHTRFPFVDVAFTGEADESLPRVIESLERGSPALDDIPGLVFRRDGTSVSTGPAVPAADLDALPLPDYEDYFTALYDSPFAVAFFPIGMAEGSRGCWWAQRRPCLFCGLNGPDLSYRAKSVPRLVRELKTLAARWPLSVLDVVDNVLAPEFLERGLTELAERPPGVPLMVEVRPDIGRETVAQMASAGVGMQPGIESLDDHALRLMGKGTTALQNIRLLKWAREAGVQVFWNYIYGLPGEREEDYEAVLTLLPAVRFLGPPTTAGPVMLQRHSPYFQDQERYGFRDVRPVSAYRYLYPFGDGALRRIAFFFDFEFEESRRPPDSVRTLAAALRQWQREPDDGALVVVTDDPRRLELRDGRQDRVVDRLVLDELDSRLYSEAAAIASRRRLLEAARGSDDPAAASCDDVDARLTRLVRQRLMVRVGDRYLSLALASGR